MGLSNKTVAGSPPVDVTWQILPLKEPYMKMDRDT